MTVNTVSLSMRSAGKLRCLSFVLCWLVWVHDARISRCCEEIHWKMVFNWAQRRVVLRVRSTARTDNRESHHTSKRERMTSCVRQWTIKNNYNALNFHAGTKCDLSFAFFSLHLNNYSDIILISRRLLLLVIAARQHMQCSQRALYRSEREKAAIIDFNVFCAVLFVHLFQSHLHDNYRRYFNWAAVSADGVFYCFSAARSTIPAIFYVLPQTSRVRFDCIYGALRAENS